jgi:hypothetical protein
MLQKESSFFLNKNKSRSLRAANGGRIVSVGGGGGVGLGH